jgi:hypothetical protein
MSAKPRRTKRTPEKAGLPTHSDATKARALKAYVGLGNITAACEAAGIGRRTWYDWIDADPAFAAAATAAHEGAIDSLEQEAYRRAKGGSDTLLIFLLKAQRRGQYGEQKGIPPERVLRCMMGMAEWARRRAADGYTAADEAELQALAKEMTAP